LDQWLIHIVEMIYSLNGLSLDILIFDHRIRDLIKMMISGIRTAEVDWHFQETANMSLTEDTFT
jgi:hypothetical protein